MATIKDIAMLAGVSHGTVSNVLNKKGNVSAEKISLVENAARKLGYKINVQAKQLRQGSARRVCFLVPSIGNKCYRDLFEAMNDVLSGAEYDVDIYYTNNLRHCEKKLLEKVASSNPSTVVLVSAFPENTGIFDQDINLIFVDREVKFSPEHAVFVSFDFERAGREMARRCIEDGKKNIAVFCGNPQYSNYALFTGGAEQVLKKERCSYKIFVADQSAGINNAFEITASESVFDAVITSDMEYVESLYQTYRYMKRDERPAIYSIASKGIGNDKEIIQYELNYKLCGRKIAKYIIKNDEDSQMDKKYLEVKNDGFYHLLQIEKEKLQKRPLTFLILKSPISNALRLLLPDFTRRTGIEVKLLEDEYWELYSSVRDSENSSAYDLIRMDMLWLSQMAEKVLLPLDAGNEAIREIIGKISPNIPDDYFKVNETMYSLPFDPSVQILYYRKELFEDALVKREFFEKYKRRLEIPRNFAEYNEVAEFFTRKYNAASPTAYGVTLAYGSAITAACDFLPRMREEKIKIFDKKGNVILNTPDMRKALREYIDSSKYAAQTVNSWWGESIQQFVQGETAMTIVFSNYASLMMNEIGSQVTGKVGFAAVPGNSPLLGGGIVGIARNSVKQKECVEFLRWLYDEETALMITRLGGYIDNKELLNSVDLLKMYPWIEGMEKAFAKGGRKNGDGNEAFDEYKFEEILGYAVRAASTGIMSIEEALGEAQQKCNRLFRE